MAIGLVRVYNQKNTVNNDYITNIIVQRIDKKFKSELFVINFPKMTSLNMCSELNESEEIPINLSVEIENNNVREKLQNLQIICVPSEKEEKLIKPYVDQENTTIFTIE
ncbi:hypothetical protein PVAND_017628 [Polypedilum vanderplanki]|uniref:Uncharacterized protein n=1 Tax=Polypedilum vanderplanki TaxID=319348 RepID=A0A9J6B9A3_POLVA|nr:hypothetical protein PVAND_017628 [Polypedilum vanderplanki]